MNIALITTQPDAASMNIHEHLLELLEWNNNTTQIAGNTVTLHNYPDRSIFMENIDKQLNADLIIFCSKHQSKSGIPSLSVHPIGNFSKAEYGGTDQKLTPAAPKAMYHCYHALLQKQKEYNLEHEVVYEATHHGPFVETPTLFIEIGSDQQQWENKTAGKALTEALIQALENINNDTPINVIGIGGLHTCPNFNKLVTANHISLGHVCPVYMLEHLNEDLLNQMIKQSNAELVILDWKGLKTYKEKIKQLTDNLSIPVKRSKEFSKD